MATNESRISTVKKYSEDNVVEIITQYIQKGYSQVEIARAFSTEQTEISDVIRAFNFNSKKTGAYKRGSDNGNYKDVDPVYIKQFVEKYYPGIVHDATYTFQDFLNEMQVAKQNVKQQKSTSSISIQQLNVMEHETLPSVKGSSYNQSSAKGLFNWSFNFNPRVIGIVFVIGLLVILLPTLLSGVFSIFDKVTGSILKVDVAQMTYDDGNYIGEIDGKKPEGYGRLQKSEGSVYIGSFEKGKYSNSGVLMNDDFRWKYVGSFHKNKFDGIGGLKNEDSSIYLGEFKNGKKSGLGAEYFVGQEIQLIEYKNNKVKDVIATVDFNGTNVSLLNDEYEVYSFSDDHIIIGPSGKTFNGYALEISETEIAFVYLKDDKRDGYLLRLFTNGNVEFGNRKDDNMSNAVKITKDTVIIGTYKNSEQVGDGIEYYAIGDTYIGTFKNSMRHGQGSYYHAASGILQQLKYQSGDMVEK